jgi:cytochrome b
MSNNSVQSVKVWDGFVRFFHWSLLATFVLAYVSVNTGMQETHAIIGYGLAALLIARIIWGIIGSTYARFSNFIFTPKTVISYLKSIVKGHPARYIGHNPAGGAMVIAIVTVLCVTIVTGFVDLAVIEFEGPLVGLLSGMSDETAYAFRAVHNMMVNILLGLIALHILGVLLASIQHRESLVRAMLTGKKHIS